MTPSQAKRANAQIRRLRAGLIEARDTLRDHFGPDDAAGVACEAALWPADAKGYVTVSIDEVDKLPETRITRGHVT